MFGAARWPLLPTTERQGNCRSVISPRSWVSWAMRYITTTELAPPMVFHYSFSFTNHVYIRINPFMRQQALQPETSQAMHFFTDMRDSHVVVFADVNILTLAIPTL